MKDPNMSDHRMSGMSYVEGRSTAGAAVSLISHADITAFVADSVNLRREDAEDYRAQVIRLREKLERFMHDHPNYGFIKSLLAGSLAKGTALKTLNDIDV